MPPPRPKSPPPAADLPPPPPVAPLVLHVEPPPAPGVQAPGTEAPLKKPRRPRKKLSEMTPEEVAALMEKRARRAARKEKRRLRLEALANAPPLPYLAHTITCDRAGAASLGPRAAADLAARTALLYGWKSKTPAEVVIPDVPGSLEFWGYYAGMVAKFRKKAAPAVLRVGDPAPAYGLTRPCVLAYSGGAESVMLRKMWPDVDQFNIRYPYTKSLKTRIANGAGLYTYPAVGLYAIVGAALGYHVTFHGAHAGMSDVLGQWRTADYYFEESPEFARRWAEYSGARYLAPLMGMTKPQVTQVLIDAKEYFCSCLRSDKRWCKRCSKCEGHLWICHMIQEQPLFDQRRT